MIRGSSPAIRLASDAVIVPIQMRAVARLAAAHRCTACGARFGAVRECAARWRRSGWRKSRSCAGSRNACRLDRRGLGRRAPVAVVVPGLAVGMAAVAVQATAMRMAFPGDAEDHGQHEAPLQGNDLQPFDPGAAVFARAHAGMSRKRRADRWRDRAQHLQGVACPPAAGSGDPRHLCTPAQGGGS
jgi:hypothetical protein